RLELSSDLGRQLPPRPGAAGDEGAERGHVRTEGAVRIDEVTHGGRRKNRPPFHQHQMQANTQRRHPPRTRHRVRSTRTGDHQARGRENAVAVRRLDRIVHFERGPEIVSRDYESSEGPTGAQAVSRRVRRKRKNSTPSRRRRFIISGLATISATIEAILEGRK